MKQNLANLKVINFDFENSSAKELVDVHTNVSLPKWAQEVVDFIKELESDSLIFCYTSGTTGVPKKITFTIEQLKSGARNTLSFFNLKKGDKALLPLSCNHIAGKMMVVRAIVGGLKLSVIEPAKNINAIEVESFDFSVLIPMQIQLLLDNSGETSVRQLGKVLIGGGIVGKGVIENLTTLKVQAWCSFGMTETMSHFALRTLSPIEQNSYTCLKGFEISSNSNSQLRLKNDELGISELQTNDVVTIESSKMFKWLGRADNVINSGALKLHPESIEASIKATFTMLPAFIVFGVYDKILGQKLVLFYEGGSFLSKVDLQVLRSILKKYEYPKYFVSCKSFERTESKKIIRKDYTQTLQ
jgi:O-succinylbenzoic acid--CoA ligase